MPSKLRVSKPDEAFDRLADIAGDDLFEPRSIYQLRSVLGGLTHFAADAEAVVPADKVTVEGSDNHLFTGLYALADRVGEITIRGSGNVVFLGADCRFPALRVTIEGDNNLIYLGAFANGGQMHVDIADSGRTIRVGEDAMLARTRLSIGLERKLEVFAADGQRISPVSGRPLTDVADILVDGRVWVGREALITEGVRIATSAIVGSRSLVIGDVAGSTINTGSPARRLGQNVTFSRSKAATLAADQALSRHSVRERRLAQLLALIEEARQADDGASLDQRLKAAAPPSPEVAAPAAVVEHRPRTLPPRRSPEDIAGAHARLRVRAGDLPLEMDSTATVVGGAAGFTHVAMDAAPLGGFRASGAGNFLFTAAGADLSGLRVEFSDASDTTIYVGPGVRVTEPSVLRVVGTTGAFVHIGAGSILNAVAATVSGPDARLIVGADCVLDGNVRLSVADGYAMFDEATGEPINPACETRIGDRVYVGLDSVIAKGADIGAGSVVAPRSVVTGELPAAGFHGGFPAQVQQKDIRWTPGAALETGKR